MKYFMVALLAVLSFSFTLHPHFNNLPCFNDSSVINHVLDGSLSEWNMDKFQEDKKTGIKYGIDNDSSNLYIGLMVQSPGSQFKLMGQGMEIYIDTRGKKKEEKGIAFPIRKSEVSFQSSSDQKPDVKELRKRFVLNMLSLQMPGFESDPADQDLMKEGSVNIRYNWDEADIMYIEYRIPLSLLSDASLDQKTLGIEFKIKAPESKTASKVVSTTTTVVGKPSSSTFTPSNTGNIPPSSTRPSDQNFWTKYTVTIPAK